MFGDAIRDLRIEQVGKAHHARLPDWRDADGRVWEISVVDLFAFYATSLKRIGKLVGHEKVDADRTNLAELLHRDRAEFERYAVTDSEIALLAFVQLRNSMLATWGVDVLQRKTLAGLSAGIFKYNFLKTTSAPSTVETFTYPVFTKSGVFQKEGKRNVFAGSR